MPESDYQQLQHFIAHSTWDGRAVMELHFILETQLENAEQLPLMSCGDVKLILGNTLKNKLDKPETLMKTIDRRHKVRREDILRRRQVLI